MRADEEEESVRDEGVGEKNARYLLPCGSVTVPVTSASDGASSALGRKWGPNPREAGKSARDQRRASSGTASSCLMDGGII